MRLLLDKSGVVYDYVVHSRVSTPREELFDEYPVLRVVDVDKTTDYITMGSIRSWLRGR